jgi:hypothetical protein
MDIGLVIYLISALVWWFATAFLWWQHRRNRFPRLISEAGIAFMWTVEGEEKAANAFLSSLHREPDIYVVGAAWAKVLNGLLPPRPSGVLVGPGEIRRDGESIAIDNLPARDRFPLQFSCAILNDDYGMAAALFRAAATNVEQARFAAGSVLTLVVGTIRRGRMSSLDLFDEDDMGGLQ